MTHPTAKLTRGYELQASVTLPAIEHVERKGAREQLSPRLRLAKVIGCARAYGCSRLLHRTRPASRLRSHQSGRAGRARCSRRPERWDPGLSSPAPHRPRGVSSGPPGPESSAGNGDRRRDRDPTACIHLRAPEVQHGYTLRLRDVPDGVEVVATPSLFDDGVDISGRPVWDRKEQRSDWNWLFQQIEESVALRLKIAGRMGPSRGAEEGTKTPR